MAAMVDKRCMPVEVNVHTTGKPISQGVVGICTNIGKRSKAAPTTHRGPERPASTLPTCCPRYPPGSTVLECRLEGDQSVAHVVQVPGDGNTATQNACILVETKQAEFGPLSRIVARPQVCSPSGQQSSRFPLTYRLETIECPDGPTATAAMIPVESFLNSSNIVTTLKTTKGGCNPDNKPSSKIVYEPTIEKRPLPIICDETVHDLPITIIDSTTSKRHASATVSRCENNDANGTKRCFETCVSRDSGCPMSVGFLCPQKEPGPCQHSVLETRIDECGPRTRKIGSSRDEGKYCCFMESKHCKDGPTATMKQQLADSSFGDVHSSRIAESSKGKSTMLHCPVQDLVTLCAGSKTRSNKQGIEHAAAKVGRRNGLDPSETARWSRFRQLRTRQVSHPRCCKPMDRPKTCFSTSEQVQKPQSGTAVPEKFKCLLMPLKVLDKLVEKTAESDQRESAKHCTKPKEPSKNDLCRSEKRPTECHGNIVPTVGSEEMLTRYRDYVPPQILFRYETCRSKRNGLQDECTLPVPSAVLELKKELMMSCNKIEGVEGQDDQGVC